MGAVEWLFPRALKWIVLGADTAYQGSEWRPWSSSYRNRRSECGARRKGFVSAAWL